MPNEKEGGTASSSQCIFRHTQPRELRADSTKGSGMGVPGESAWAKYETDSLGADAVVPRLASPKEPRGNAMWKAMKRYGKP